MGGRVGGMGPDRKFEGALGLVELSLLGVEHGQIVVGLGQFREIGGQRLERRNRLGRTAELGEGDAPEEAQLRILWLSREKAVGTLECFRKLTLFQQGLDLCRVCVGGQCEAGGCQKRDDVTQERVNFHCDIMARTCRFAIWNQRSILPTR